MRPSQAWLCKAHCCVLCVRACRIQCWARVVPPNPRPSDLPPAPLTDPDWRPFALFGVARKAEFTITGPVHLPNGGLALQVTKPLLVETRQDTSTTVFEGPPGPYQCGALCQANASVAGRVFWGYAMLSVDISALARGFGTVDWATALSERE